MSNKFLVYGQGSINLSNGSANVYSSTLGAVSLSSSKPVKTNSVKQLVSTNLDITDVNNLTTQLTEKDELTFVEDDTHTTPDVGKNKIYFKTDGLFYSKNNAGVESLIGGGGGVSTSNAPVDNNSIVTYDGKTGDVIKFEAGFSYDPEALKMNVSDIQTKNTVSVDSELLKVKNITSATQTPDITTFSGEVNVPNVKSSGTLNLIGDNVDVLSNVLTHNGFKVYTTNDGSLADLTAKTQNIDLALTNTEQTSFNGKLQTSTTNSFNNQLAFTDLTNPRASTAVGFVSGNGNDGLKWLCGSIGDINEVTFQTYTTNDSIMLKTNNALDTVKIKPDGTVQLQRTGVYDGTVDAILKLNTDGTLEKSSATCDTLGNMVVTTIDANSYTEGGNTATMWRKKGTFNYLVGLLAGDVLTTGANNIVVGNNAGSEIEEGNNNVCIGNQAGRYIIGNTGNPMGDNVCIGQSALRGSTGSISHCSRNIGIGNSAGSAITTGSDNIFLGTLAGKSNTTGSRNIFIGGASSITPTITTNSVSLGYGASVANNGVNQNALGYNATTTQDNQVCLGNSAVTQIINAGEGTCDIGSLTNPFKDVYINGSISQEDEISMTLINGWNNFGSGYKSAVYWKDRNGIVHLEGLIKDGTSDIFFILPAGYRPSGRLMFQGYGSVNDSVVNGRIDIDPNGNCYFLGIEHADYLTLNGISFRGV